MKLTSQQLAAYFDHTLLSPAATKSDIENLCMEARQYGFYAVCVNPCYVKDTASFLAGSNVRVCTVVGFPLGANTSLQKQREAEEAAANGAAEVDMVMAVGAAKGGDWQTVAKDIEAVAKAVREQAVLKVILETFLLTEEEIARACGIAKNAGADFVKTSTGFAGGGATVEAVALMRSTVGSHMGVKASGGIRTLRQALAMIEAGANRIGSSSGAKILADAACVE